MQDTQMSTAIQSTYFNAASILSRAYAFHLTRNADQIDPKTREPSDELRLAQQVVDEFLEKNAPPGSPEAKWLDEMRTIVLTFSRELDRRREQLHEKRREAAEELRDRLIDTQKSQGVNASLLAVWRKSLPVVSILVGLITAQTVKPIDTDGTELNLLNSAFTWVVIGALVGFSFSLALKSLSIMYTGIRNMQMVGRHYKYCHLARRLCLEGEKDAQKFYLHQLREAWKHYSGKETPETISYLSVIEADMRREEVLYEELFGGGVVPWLTRTIQPWLANRSARSGSHLLQYSQPKAAE